MPRVRREISAALQIPKNQRKRNDTDMEWEVRIIEWIQDNMGGFGKAAGDVFSFIGGETGLMILLVAVLFCWKKEAGQKLALIIASLHAWFAMIKAAVQ